MLSFPLALGVIAVLLCSEWDVDCLGLQLYPHIFLTASHLSSSSHLESHPWICSSWKKIAFFFYLFKLRMFSLWTGIFFYRCAPLSSWSDRTYPAAFSRTAARGESVWSRYPWRKDYPRERWWWPSHWCHPGRLRGAVFCHLQCLRVKPQDTGHVPTE